MKKHLLSYVGHLLYFLGSFIVFLGEGYHPIHRLGTVALERGLKGTGWRSTAWVRLHCLCWNHMLVFSDLKFFGVRVCLYAAVVVKTNA